ncbi:MAG: CDP-diacylglycerol--glycerol-3-phosphate 3-phosphatidyltransferase [Gemmatimonadetes bacterium]|nr:MAG: CDP-diacylglycerol--glycerol-3-phosphate 3-phosphatidyltransferase [Gemmatimonadota bacterium]
MWVIPNILTVIRVLLTPVFIVFFLSETSSHRLIAVFLFLVASLTDFLDGYLARKYNWTSVFGKYVDPLADKILTLSAFIVFAQQGYLIGWMVVIVALREIIITIIRSITLYHNKLINTSRVGKWKTVAQLVTIFIVLFYAAVDAYRQTPLSGWVVAGVEWVILISMSIAVILTVVSGYLYFSQNRTVLRSILFTHES